jgi:peptidoglycan/xylan/chitin deacetylase (PgdA/CDA1 family)
MVLYSLARKVNAQIKKYKKYQNGRYLSPSRRIEFVSPPRTGRFVAMTFDDGPTTLPTTSDPAVGLTESILNTLAKYGAKGTFDIIGTTAENYPDEAGTVGNFTWSGVHFDHYPKFGCDSSAGAVNCPELIKRIIEEGHEITSHTYSHRLFGPMRAVYGQRTHFTDLNQVVTDLERLDTYMLHNFGYKMRLSRPPHYIDRIPDGSDSYDAYRIMGYNYLAASFDGAGWQPLESYEKEVAAMVDPLRRALESNPDALNGRIIFQKDGCNMNLRTPVADGLDAQLRLLAQYGYKVITVSDLLRMSPFEDVSTDCEVLPHIQRLLDMQHTVGYRNNTFAPERYISADEFAIMCADPSLFRDMRTMSYRDMAAIAHTYLESKGIHIRNASGNSLLRIAAAKGLSVDESKLKDKKNVKRIDAVELIAALSEIL